MSDKSILVGITKDTVQADVRNKEQAIQYVKKSCRERGCTCDPQITFNSFDVNYDDTNAEVTVHHESFCTILTNIGQA